MHDELLLRFFMTFARFEYALKASGHVRAGENGAAKANWHAVEAALGTDDRTAVVAKAGVLLKDPPRRQVLTDGCFDWQTAGSAGGEPQNLVTAVKRVRNNLFHGGKFTSVPAYLSPRQVELVTCAGAVLDELLRLPALAAVAARFNGYDGPEG
jgi:hypothetical protein